MVKEVDADGSGTVDFSEFLALMSKSVSPFFSLFGVFQPSLFSSPFFSHPLSSRLSFFPAATETPTPPLPPNR